MTIVVDADNRPPMLEKSMYNSWESRMRLYIKGKENGLPPEVYSLVNHHQVDKEIWDRVKLLMQGTKLSYQERECKLYDDFDRFSSVKGDNPITCLNKAMALMLTVMASCFPSTNNQLRTSSNPRNQATIQDSRVTIQQVQRRQGQSFAGTGTKGNAISSGGNNAAGQARVVKCYNCQCEGHMARQCTKPKRPRKKMLLTSDLDAYDSDCDDISSAKAVLMANLSSYDLDVLFEEKESLLQTFTVFKMKSKEKENKYMNKEIDLEKKIKELDNIIYKVGQSAQIVHMLTKLQVFYDDTHKEALGYQNPFYLKKALRIKPTLYDGVMISKKHDVIFVVDEEETLILEEESRLKMLAKK
ncbi:retrovirus-related pol polyprotein from transposon TNT 1-94 [Tanacetum coccineum]